GDTMLVSVNGLANYPSLQELHLYESGASSVSLAGCSNLAVVALVGSSPNSSSNVDQWFIDLAAAEPHAPAGGPQGLCTLNSARTFYYPSSPPVTTNSATARETLQQWWNLLPIP